jgi:hypothetical protein
MSISPIFTQSTACARPRGSWSTPATPSVMRTVSPTYRSWMVDTQVSAEDCSISDSVFLGHLGTNHNGTTGSKRLNPGPFCEVLT